MPSTISALQVCLLDCCAEMRDVKENFVHHELCLAFSIPNSQLFYLLCYVVYSPLPTRFFGEIAWYVLMALNRTLIPAYRNNIFGCNVT